MQIGQILDDGTFDLSDIPETNQVLLQTDQNGILQTRWIYADAEGRMIIHERSKSVGDVIARGTLLEVGPGSMLVQSLSDEINTKKVAKLLVDIDWDDTSKFVTSSIEVDGEARECVLAPVKLI